MKSKEDIELECLWDGLLNDLTLLRMVRKLVADYDLPDGRYDLEGTNIATTPKGKPKLFLEFKLPKERPIKYGSAVIGGDVHLFVEIVCDPATSLMDLIVRHFSLEDYDGATHYYINMNLYEGNSVRTYLCDAQEE